jgi:hypothetical protein
MAHLPNLKAMMVSQKYKSSCYLKRNLLSNKANFEQIISSPSGWSFGFDFCNIFDNFEAIFLNPVEFELDILFAVLLPSI